MNKACTKCGVEKPNTHEFFRQTTVGRLCARCKACDSEYNKQYRKQHAEKLQARRKAAYWANREENIRKSSEWYRENLDRKRAYDKIRNEELREEIAAKKQEYYKQNRDATIKRVSKYVVDRYRNDDCFRTCMRLRHRLREAFKRYSKNGKVGASKDYGINWQAIMEHLGPCPGNLDDYHIDHIIPLSTFCFDDLEQIRLAFAPENHRWLTKKENLKKGAGCAPINKEEVK